MVLSTHNYLCFSTSVNIQFYCFLVHIFIKNLKLLLDLEGLGFFFLFSVLNLTWGSTWVFAKLLANICPNSVHRIIPRLPHSLLSYMKVSSLRVTVFRPFPLWAVPGTVQMSYLVSIPPTTTHSVPPPPGSPELSLRFQSVFHLESSFAFAMPAYIPGGLVPEQFQLENSSKS